MEAGAAFQWWSKGELVEKAEQVLRAIRQAHGASVAAGAESELSVLPVEFGGIGLVRALPPLHPVGIGLHAAGRDARPG